MLRRRASPPCFAAVLVPADPRATRHLVRRDRSQVPQELCERPLAPELLQHYFCHQHGRSRTRGCTANFVQELCDLEACEAMLRERESEVGRSFDAVLRLRADLFWETRFEMPWPLPPNDLFVPWLESGHGYNDHVAFGSRAAMRVYLTRGRHLNRSELWRGSHSMTFGRNGRPRVTSEMFLSAVLQQEGVRARELRHWLYCLVTRRAMLDQRGLYGCIARIRARTRCASLVCARDNVKYWCNCYNRTCASLSMPDEPSVAKLGPFEPRAVSAERRAALRDAVVRKRGTVCVDVNASSQLLLSSGQGDASVGAACPWSPAEFTRFRYHIVSRAANCSITGVRRAY